MKNKRLSVLLSLLVLALIGAYITNSSDIKGSLGSKKNISKTKTSSSTSSVLLTVSEISGSPKKSTYEADGKTTYTLGAWKIKMADTANLGCNRWHFSINNADFADFSNYTVKINDTAVTGFYSDGDIDVSDWTIPNKNFTLEITGIPGENLYTEEDDDAVSMSLVTLCVFDTQNNVTRSWSPTYSTDEKYFSLQTNSTTMGVFGGHSLTFHPEALLTVYTEPGTAMTHEGYTLIGSWAVNYGDKAEQCDPFTFSVLEPSKGGLIALNTVFTDVRLNIAQGVVDFEQQIEAGTYLSSTSSDLSSFTVSDVNFNPGNSYQYYLYGIKNPDSSYEDYVYLTGACVENTINDEFTWSANDPSGVDSLYPLSMDSIGTGYGVSGGVK